MRKPEKDGRRFGYVLVKRVGNSFEVDHGGRTVMVHMPEEVKTRDKNKLSSPGSWFGWGWSHLLTRDMEHSKKGGVGLKVGKHDGKLGIVFIIRREKKNFSPHELREHGARERGLVEWNNGTGADLSEAVAKLALKFAGISDPTERLIEVLSEEWKNNKMWDDLARRNKLGDKLEILKEVLES
jgi:hypothetical protein